MKIVIVYFSGTGNTKFLSEKIRICFTRKGVGDVELIPVEIAIENIDRLKSKEMVLGLAFPVYDYKPPLKIFEFLKALGSDSRVKASFILSTYSSDKLDCNSHVVDILLSNQISVIYESSIKSPSAVLFFYGLSKIKFLSSKTRFDKNIRRVIERTSSEILSSYDKYELNNYTVKPIFNRFNKIYQWLSSFIFGRLFYRDLKIDPGCSSCGFCIGICPTKNLSILKNRVIIEKSNNCQKCLRCVQSCKSKSINFSNFKRRGNYNNKTIISCFENS